MSVLPEQLEDNSRDTLRQQTLQHSFSHFRPCKNVKIAQYKFKQPFILITLVETQWVADSPQLIVDTPLIMVDAPQLMVDIPQLIMIAIIIINVKMVNITSHQTIIHKHLLM